MTDLNRRHFLAAGAAATAGAMLSGPAQAAAPKDPMPAKWDETYDVVVIGSGFAGLAAAIEAKAAGSTVLHLRPDRSRLLRCWIQGVCGGVL